MHPKLWWENRGKILGQLYNMHLSYAVRYKLVHWRNLLYLASPSSTAGRFADPATGRRMGHKTAAVTTPAVAALVTSPVAGSPGQGCSLGGVVAMVSWWRCVDYWWPGRWPPLCGSVKNGLCTPTLLMPIQKWDCRNSLIKYKVVLRLFRL